MAEKTTGASVAPATTVAPAVETTPATESANPIVEEAQGNELGNIQADPNAKKYKVSFTVNMVETATNTDGRPFFSLRSNNFTVDGVRRRDFPWMVSGDMTTSNRITKGWRCVLQLISANPIGRMLLAKTKGRPSTYEGAEELAIFLLTNMKISGEVVIIPAGTPLFDGTISEDDATNFNITAYSLALGAEDMMFAKMLLQDIKERQTSEMPLILE